MLDNLYEFLSKVRYVYVENNLVFLVIDGYKIVLLLNKEDSDNDSMLYDVSLNLYREFRKIREISYIDFQYEIVLLLERYNFIPNF